MDATIVLVCAGRFTCCAVVCPRVSDGFVDQWARSKNAPALHSSFTGSKIHAGTRAGAELWACEGRHWALAAEPTPDKNTALAKCFSQINTFVR